MSNSEERMINYYPDVLKSILEYQAIMYTEGAEIDLLKERTEQLVNDAYMETMGEERTRQWEKVFGITPSPDSTLQDRRNVILARRRGVGKLNSKKIESIVNAFTKGSAITLFRNGVIIVRVLPPPNNEQYRFPDVENELRRRRPAHLDLEVSKYYSSWLEVATEFTDWNDLLASFASWKEVKEYVPDEGGIGIG